MQYFFFSPSPSPSLASTNSSLLRHTQSRSSESFSSNNKIPASGVDVAFSQRSSLSSFGQTSHFFSRPTSQNHSVLSSDSHLLNFDLTTDQYSTPPTPNRVDYPLIRFHQLDTTNVKSNLKSLLNSII